MVEWKSVLLSRTNEFQGIVRLSEIQRSSREQNTSSEGVGKYQLNSSEENLQRCPKSSH